MAKKTEKDEKKSAQKKKPIVNVDFKVLKDKATQAGDFINETAAKAGDILSDKATEAKDKASQAGELIGEKATEAKDKAAEAVKDSSVYVADKAVQAKHDYDLRRFRPLTKDQLESAIRTMPEMVHIVDWDKRTEEEVCKKAVAFNDGTKEMRVISVLTKNASLMNASFYPDIQEGIYYQDPSNPNYYINLNDYFDYIKKAKVHELNRIAQDLGAKHIKIILKAEKKMFVQNKGKIGVSAGKKGKTESSHSDSNTQFVSLEVASDKKYKGHEAKMPELHYFKNEPDILNIINRRLDKNNPIYSDTETFKYSNSSGIKKNDAVKIEGMLKKFKIGGNASITSEVENEEKLFFEYQIEYPED